MEQLGGYIMNSKDHRTEKIISDWLAADPATQDEVLEILQTAFAAKQARQHLEPLSPPRLVSD